MSKVKPLPLKDAIAKHAAKADGRCNNKGRIICAKQVSDDTLAIWARAGVYQIKIPIICYSTGLSAETIRKALFPLKGRASTASPKTIMAINALMPQLKELKK
jgi:hypothetical protein